MAALTALAVGVVIAHEVHGADLGHRTGRQWRPYLEWSIPKGTVDGNPFDLVATVTFVHSKSGESRATEMFYDGGRTWRFRFTGTTPGLWRSTMAGGVANIWGNLFGPKGSVDTNRSGSFPCPKPYWIKTWSEFFRNRFFADMVRDNAITDGLCLKRRGGQLYVFYKENATSIRMDLSKMPEMRIGIAVDALQHMIELTRAFAP